MHNPIHVDYDTQGHNTCGINGAGATVKTRAMNANKTRQTNETSQRQTMNHPAGNEKLTYALIFRDLYVCCHLCRGLVPVCRKFETLDMMCLWLRAAVPGVGRVRKDLLCRGTERTYEVSGITSK